MNRRGQIPTILLFITALVLSAATLFSFTSFKGGLDINSKVYADMLGDGEYRERFAIEEAKFLGRSAIISGGDVRAKFKELANKSVERARFEGAGNFYKQIRDDTANNPTFTFEKKTEGGKEVYILEIKDLFVISERGKNSIKRNFNLKIEFDGQGNVRKTFIQ